MTTRTFRTNLVLITGLALLLAACGAAPTPGATAAPSGAAAEAPNATTNAQQISDPAATTPTTAVAGTSDACALLTKPEVEAAFNETMLEPAASVKNGDASCSWTHEAGGLDLTVTISSRPSSPAAMTGLAAAYGDAGIAVAGVGDAAFEFAGILEFVKGTTLVIIGTGDGPAIITDTDFQELTKMAAGRA